MGNNLRIMIGHDDSDRADAAIDDLWRAGMPRYADAMVVSVAEGWLVAQLKGDKREAGRLSEQGGAATAARRATVDPVKEAQHWAVRARERILSYFSEWNVACHTASGSPPREILRKAMEWQPDIIILGAKGQSVLSGFPLGSVSQKIVNEANCSVRVARGVPWKESSPVRIVIGVDGRPNSAWAVDAVASRPWPPQSEVRVVTVIDSMAQIAPALQFPGWAPGYDRPAGLAFVDAALNQLAEAELIVSSKVENGDPKQVLVAAAQDWGAECIFIGSSCDDAGLETRLLGSVSTAVVARAHCSVEVVRRLQESSEFRRI